MLPLLGVLLAFSSCQKNKMENPKQENGLIAMSSDQPNEVVLNFDSLDDYETIIGQVAGTNIPNKPNGFVSLKATLDQLDSLKYQDSTAYYSSPYIGDTIYEDYGRLLDVLNQDKIVKLNGYFVRVDLADDSVYVINSVVENSYDIIKNHTPNDSLKSYPTSMGVLRLAIWITIKLPTFGCHEIGAKRLKMPNISSCSKRYRTKEKVVYQAAGIYFSILAKAKNQHKIAWVWWSWRGGQPLLYMNFTWKVKCGAIQPWFRGYASTWSGLGYSGSSSETTFRPYSSTRALTSFNFSASIHTPCNVDYLQIQS